MKEKGKGGQVCFGKGRGLQSDHHAENLAVSVSLGLSPMLSTLRAVARCRYSHSLAFVHSTRTMSHATHNTITPTPVTAACCIIGDEILNGKTKDSNSHFLGMARVKNPYIHHSYSHPYHSNIAKYLFDCGIDLKRIEVVGDDYGAIAETVTRLSSQHDLVFTSGGIG